MEHRWLKAARIGGVSAPSNVPVRTTIVHRPHRGTTPWWHSSVVCDVTSRVDADQLCDVEALTLPLARAGVNAVLIRPQASLVWGASPRLAPFVQAMHRVGVKVLVHLPGATSTHSLDPTEGLTTFLGRLRACVDAGVDGIDVGAIAADAQLADSDAHERFAHLIRVVMSEVSLADTVPIVTAALPQSTPDVVRRHLEEEWFHHLRDSSVEHSPWDSALLAERIATAFEARDPLGHVPAWTYSRAHAVEDSYAAALADASWGAVGDRWESDANTDRRRAMLLFSLSLPGAVYLPFGDVGRYEAVPPERHLPARVRRLWRDEADPGLALVTRALRVRSEHGMGAASVAQVRGLPWAHSGVSVHMTGAVMVVLNTSDRAVEVPAEHRFLVGSSPVEHEAGQPVGVLPQSCAWFETARVRPPVVRVD